MKPPDQEFVSAGEKTPSWEKFNETVKMIIIDKRSVVSRLLAEAVRMRLRRLNMSLDLQGLREGWGWPIKSPSRFQNSPPTLECVDSPSPPLKSLNLSSLTFHSCFCRRHSKTTRAPGGVSAVRCSQKRQKKKKYVNMSPAFTPPTTERTTTQPHCAFPLVGRNMSWGWQT